MATYCRANKHIPYGKTFLHFAVENGQYDVCQVLLEKTSLNNINFGKIKTRFVNESDSRGITPLQLAIKGNYMRIVELLLSFIASVPLMTLHDAAKVKWKFCKLFF